MTSVFEKGGKARESKDFNRYWQSIGEGRNHLTEEDFGHIAGCALCKQKLFAALQGGRLKISAELMKQVKDDGLRQQIVRTICLRAVGSSILN